MVFATIAIQAPRPGRPAKDPEIAAIGTVRLDWSMTSGEMPMKLDSSSAMVRLSASFSGSDRPDGA